MMLLWIKMESDETDDAGEKEVQIIVLKFNNYSVELADTVSF